MSVQRVFDMERLQSQTVCMGNPSQEALEILKLIPDCVFQSPAPMSGFKWVESVD